MSAPPAKAWRTIEREMNDFLAHPDDWDRFNALDVMMASFNAKWGAYACSRRVAAALADNGIEDLPDEVA